MLQKGLKMTMRLKIYNLLVNKHPGIKIRYHNMHDHATGIKKTYSWLYLLWLNFAYYILFCRFLGEEPGCEMYEEKELLTEAPESSGSPEVSLFIEKLSQYEYISFDIFDTLIFRPFSEPTDLFYFIGEKLGYMDFKRIRMEAEFEARQRKFRKSKTYEVTLADIWNVMEEKTGLSANRGMVLELETELQFCYANPFMQEVYQTLCKMGKQILIISDMYLSGEFLKELLLKNGYGEFQCFYVSCEYDKNKGTGELFELVKMECGLRNFQMVHVGDNLVSDVQMAQKAKLHACHYPNVNQEGKKYRAYDMSPIVGGAYRGLINNHLYSGVHKDSVEYEYGYVYGGLFVTGYCAFIHEYCRKNQIEKVLFLSRDGDILKQAYELLYPGEHTEYVYWSRKVSVKLMAGADRYDYFRRFLYHKVNQGYTLKQIFVSMELESLLEKLPIQFQAKDELTSSNVEKLKEFLLKNWEEVLYQYEAEQEAAKSYYADILKGYQRAVAVDIGWAGSGAIALHHLVNHVWNLSCDIVGILAGTNTIHNAEPDCSETFLQSGRLVSYLYSMSHNRDLMKKHDLNRDYNIFWELLLSSPQPQFMGFDWEDESRQQVRFRFGRKDANSQGIVDIQQGILRFISDYKKHFGDIPYMQSISGRDAYAPMLAASGNHERYLKMVKERFHLVVGIE